ncbi:MAG: hypothetical protein ABW170_10640 [Candidatus Thiodiazotropha sp. L084R]
MKAQKNILRIIFLSLVALLASLIVQYAYKYFFDNYTMQKIQLADRVYAQGEYANKVPDIIPRNYSIAKVEINNDHAMVTFYYDDGEVWSYHKGRDWLDYKKLTMTNAAYWFIKLPVLLSAIIFAVVLIVHISRTGRLIFLGPRFDLHTPFENELLLYSFLLLMSYLVF